MATAQASIKVTPATREKVRYASVLAHMSQTDLVEAAVDEYVARHAEELARGIARARAALRLGDDAAVAYLLDEDADAVSRVSGDESRTGG